jgi:hypothetical protein
MKLQKIGGYASLGIAFLFVAFLVMVFVVFPSLGLTGPSDFEDMTKWIAAVNASALPFLLLSLDFILFSIAFILIVLSLQERMENYAPYLMQISIIGASIFAALFLAAGVIGMALPSIAVTNDTSAYRAANKVMFALLFAGAHASGWALLLSGWAALKSRKLPRLLSGFQMLLGIAWIAEFIVEPLQVIDAIPAIIWGVWLGVVLLRSMALPQEVAELSLHRTSS